MFHFFNPDEKDTIWKDEFPDNKSALLWFKLEYGG